MLQLWGVYSIYTWWVVSVDNYSPPWQKEHHWEGIWHSLTGGNDCVIAIYLLCLGMFLGHACALLSHGAAALISIHSQTALPHPKKEACAGRGSLATFLLASLVPQLGPT